MLLTQNLSVTIFAANQFLVLCNPWGSDNIMVTYYKKHIKDAICVLGQLYYPIQWIAYHPPFCQHGSMCKSVRVHTLKLQFLAFSTSFDVMCHVYSAKKKKKSTSVFFSWFVTFSRMTQGGRRLENIFKCTYACDLRERCYKCVKMVYSQNTFDYWKKIKIYLR